MNYNNYGQPPQNLMQWGRGYGQQPQQAQQAQQPQKFTQSMLTQAAAAAPVAQAAPAQTQTQSQFPISQQTAQPQTQPAPQPPPPPPQPPQPGKINWNTIQPKAYDGTMTGGGGNWDNAITRRLSQNNAVPNQ